MISKVKESQMVLGRNEDVANALLISFPNGNNEYSKQDVRDKKYIF